MNRSHALALLFLLAILNGPPVRAGTFAVVGDTRQRNWLEAIIGKEDNPAERPILAKDVARERPEFVVHTGDLVDVSSLDADWKYYDSLFQPLADLGIALFPAIGNHDVLFGMPDQLLARFPFIRDSRWYSKVEDGIGLVWLDSNFSDLGDDDVERQKSWLAETLSRYDHDPGVSGVLLFDHHPPYTNENDMGDDGSIHDVFLPAFTASRKAVAFFSGHVHSFERFLIGGKHYIVMGAGGAPRDELLTGADARHQDLFHFGALRPFAYLLLTPHLDTLHLRMRGLDKGETEVHAIDEFSIELPGHRPYVP